MHRRRKKKTYFERVEDAPSPLVAGVERRVSFSEAHVMGISWHGRYASYAEEAWAELGRRYGLGVRDFCNANLQAPIVLVHLDYYRPLQLDETFSTEARWVWCEGARINTEYAMYKQDGELAASGYSVQMLIHGDSRSPCLVEPPLLQRWRERWTIGEFA